MLLVALACIYGITGILVYMEWVTISDRDPVTAGIYYIVKACLFLLLYLVFKKKGE